MSAKETDCENCEKTFSLTDHRQGSIGLNKGGEAWDEVGLKY